SGVSLFKPAALNSSGVIICWISSDIFSRAARAECTQLKLTQTPRTKQWVKKFRGVFIGPRDASHQRDGVKRGEIRSLHRWVGFCKGASLISSTTSDNICHIKSAGVGSDWVLPRLLESTYGLTI